MLVRGHGNLCELELGVALVLLIERGELGAVRTVPMSDSNRCNNSMGVINQAVLLIG
jgi:hypothetical protein